MSEPLVRFALRPVNVRDFGAVGDGVTDDTAAIAAAMAFAKSVGGYVEWPTGTYKCDQAIQVSWPCRCLEDE